MATKTITLMNDFHETRVDVRVTNGRQLSNRQESRVRRELCGVAGCKCGGMHGRQATDACCWLNTVDHSPWAI